MSKHHAEPYTCSICKDYGRIEVSYADPENGPTDDPADEFGWEPCDCEKGRKLLHKENEDNEKALNEFLESIGDTMIPVLVVVS